MKEVGDITATKLISSKLICDTISGVTPAYASPRLLRFWHDEAVVVAGNAFTHSFQSIAHGTYSYQDTAAMSDEFKHPERYFSAGTYTFTVLGYKRAAAAIMDWYLDTTKIVENQDWYNATDLANQYIATTSIVIATSGVYVLSGEVVGQSGSGYGIYLTKYWFTRTS